MSTLETIWLLIFITYKIHITECQLNEWMKETGPNGEEIWRSTSDFVPVESQSFGNITLGQIMSMEFDFTFWGRTNYPQSGFYEMFFRVGYDAALSRGCNGEGSRYPSFWLTNNADTMHVSVSSGTSCQPLQSLSDYGTITIGATYHINIAFNNTELQVTVNDNWHKSWSRQPIPKTYLGDTVPIWFMSNKYAGAFNLGNATLSNITLTSNMFSIAPTNAPTNPSRTPTKMPSLAPAMTPTMTPTMRPPMRATLDGIISESTTAVQPVQGNEKNSLLDTTVAAVVIAVMAGSCCVICGIVILCKRRNKIEKCHSETDNGMRAHRKQQHIEMRSADNKHVHISISGEDEYNEPIFTPDGVVKNQILGIVDTCDQGEYLSPAQKEQLYSTPKGPDTKDEDNGLYAVYLRKAQCEQTLVDADDDKTSDEEVLSLRTDGYIGAGEIDNNDNDGSSLSEMSDVVIGNKLTIGAEVGDDDENEHEYEYDDDSLSELNESDDNFVTMQ